MSASHPIIAVTGSSGAGTTTARVAFEHVFHRLNVTAVHVEGDAFHAFNRREMGEAVQRALIRGENFSHFGPSGNHLDRLEELFASYGEDGTGLARRYLHSEDDAKPFGQASGTFTPWEPVPPDSDLLLYEGLHGGIKTDEVDIARYVDLLVGVVPIINLEWIQKIHRDTDERGYSRDDVKKTILRRMSDYVNYITPQFSLTDINFQRVPLVDTSNPFVSRDVPSADESMVVIRFRNPRKWKVDFPHLLTMIKDSFMSRPNTIVVPGSKMRFAMEIIIEPIIRKLLSNRPPEVDRRRNIGDRRNEPED